MAEEMTIGRLAKAAGVNVETIRYYQRRGLIEEPQKPLGGQRRYPESALNALAFVRRAQNLGFSLDEVKALMALTETSDCGAARVIAEQKRSVLASRIEELERMRKQLDTFVAACKRNKGKKPCPIVVALWKKEGDL
ncbi:MAG TPA: MerR family transcriptional regulator [Usitatibacter sp.]|nr:MerR family transcriptional regulator [Usitatibacter sp.]